MVASAVSGGISLQCCSGQIPFRAHRSLRCAPGKRSRFLLQSSGSDAEKLTSWAEERKLDLSGVRIAQQDGAVEPVLLAARAAPAGEAIFSLSEQQWISQQSVKDSEIGSKVKNLPVWLQVTLFLVFEKALGTRSKWANYIQAMSAQTLSPIYWPEEDRKLLENTQLLQSLEGYEEYFRQEFEELQQGLFEKHPYSFTLCTLESFRWAALTVRGRSHPPLEGSALALTPVADLVRHSRSGSVEASISTKRGIGSSQKLLRLSAARNLQEGEVLTMDYAPDKLDNQLLLDHGVLDEANPGGGYLLALSMDPDDPNCDDKLDILDVNQLEQSPQFPLRARQSPGRQPGLLGFLRLLNCSGADAFLLEALFRTEVWGFMQQPVSEDNERAVCDSMILGCKEALAAYPTSIDQDLELLRDSDAAPTGSAARAAITIRMGEKEGLETAMRYFEDRKTKLKQLEYYQERRLKNLGLLDDDGETTWDGFFEDSMF